MVRGGTLTGREAYRLIRGVRDDDQADEEDQAGEDAGDVQDAGKDQGDMDSREDEPASAGAAGSMTG